MRYPQSLVWIVMGALSASLSAAGTVADLTKRARSEVQHRRYANAIILVNQAIRLNPKNSDLYLVRGTAKFGEADWNGALTDASMAVELDPNNAAAYAARAGARGQQGDYDGTIADCNRALKLDPRNAVALDNLAGAELMKRNYPSAIMNATQAIKVASGFWSPYNNRGLAELHTHHYDAAVADFTQAIKLDSNDAGLYRNRAWTYLHKKDYRSAIADFTKIVALRPADPVGDDGLGNVRNQGYVRAQIWVLQRRLNMSVPANEQLSAYVDQHAEGWTKKIGLFLLGRLTEEALVAAAESSDPHKNRVRHCEAWYYAGMKHLLANQPEKAKTCFLKCLATKAETCEEYLGAQTELANG